jgi:hypothetical protein
VRWLFDILTFLWRLIIYGVGKRRRYLLGKSADQLHRHAKLH